MLALSTFLYILKILYAERFCPFLFPLDFYCCENVNCSVVDDASVVDDVSAVDNADFAKLYEVDAWTCLRPSWELAQASQKSLSEHSCRQTSYSPDNPKQLHTNVCSANQVEDFVNKVSAKAGTQAPGSKLDSGF
mmetsp:Transcript_3439/g.3916  ORF Transcript_3439/g.3916 Transcript_3439/m.3916 type:complete len:135 (-) Transcript_3439:332-736(-)